ncbi:MAG: hypothetical protein J6M35_07620 [Clostridia bacterium]|nr:hypothetical protein [Clostridia bacterium]
MKRFFSDFLLKTGVFLLLNLPVILVYFVVSIVFKFPVLDELVDMISDKSAVFEYAFNTVLYILYVAVYYLILYLAIFKNNSARVAYLNATASEEYSFKGEAIQYLKSFFLSDLFAAVLVCTISFVLIGTFSENKFLRVLFITEYSLSQIIGTMAAAVFYLLFTSLFIFFATVTSQYIWNKNRLCGKA